MDERIELLRRAYETFNSGDLDFSLFHPEVRIVQTARLIGSEGVFEGHDGVRRSWGELLEGFDPVRFEPESYDELEGGRMLIRCRWLGRGVVSGIEIDTPVWHVWAFRDGRLAEMEVYASEREALAAATQSS